MACVGAVKSSARDPGEKYVPVTVGLDVNFLTLHFVFKGLFFSNIIFSTPLSLSVLYVNLKLKSFPFVIYSSLST